MFNCKTADLINQKDLQSENVNIFKAKKKKKHKHKLLDEVENISDYKNEDSDVIAINQKDLRSENAKEEMLQEKKKKKHKQKLLHEVDYKNEDSNIIEINQEDLRSENVKELQEKKKKHRHKLFSEMEIICNDKIQESVIDESESNRMLDTLDVQKGNECKQADVDKRSYNSIDSSGIEANWNNLSHEDFDGLPGPKRKKHRHNLVEVENTPITVKSNNTSNDNISHKHMKDDGKKSILQNPVALADPIRKRKNQKHGKKGIETPFNDLPEKEKNVECNGPENNFPEVENMFMSFDPFLTNMDEVPVPFPVPLLHEGETTATISPERKAYLEENGVTIHTGKWTKTEDDIITRNFLQFGLHFGVNNPYQLLGINQKDDKVVKFKRKKHFLVRLGKDLNNRPLRSIYMRARKILHPLKTQKKLSAEEAADLKHAYQLVGNKWSRISDMLSRSDDTCHSAYRWHKADINKGKWTPEEESNLIKAIKIVTGEEDISAIKVKNNQWAAVAKYVSTRNEFQCHKQWAEHLAWDPSVTEKKCWKKCHYGKLIYLLKKKFSFNSESEIDWRELHKHFIDVAPSYIFLHKKWFYLKGRLPKELRLSYRKCLNALKRMYKERYKIFTDENF